MATKWFKEWFTPHEAHLHRLKKILVKTRTSFQEAVIADSFSFGRCLILDGEMQSAQTDEFIYHETLVHPALLTHPRPKSVLIMGGGEGATTREILKHQAIERIVLVDIDGEVIQFCKKHLPTWHQGSFNNSKVEVIVDDAKKFIETTHEKFDIIISDLPSPAEGGPAFSLYTVEFYRTLVGVLSKGGIFVMQAGSGHLLQIELHKVLYATLKKVFRTVRPFYSYIPSFDVPWAFLIASQTTDPAKLTAREIDRRIKNRIRGKLQAYDGDTHSGLFGIPKHLKELLAKEKRILTKARPIYLYK